MSIIRPSDIIRPRPKNYHAFRQEVWTHRLTEWGKSFSIVFTPKRNLFFKDVWDTTEGERPITKSMTKNARALASYILTFDDVTYLEFKGVYIMVQWEHLGKLHELPNQILDDRSKYLGK